MSIRENVKRLLVIDQKETVLRSEIAAMVPTVKILVMPAGICLRNG
ncbi:MAG: hypothetical protein K6U04_01280 [Armatimonadetes bacterium]|nr:hypothetical protein [Armatimonadota bacterium]